MGLAANAVATEAELRDENVAKQSLATREFLRIDRIAFD
jgi:hypothetical protein